MANFVIKKDGSKVSFDAGKIKSAIVAACLETGFLEDKASSVAEEISGLVNMSFESQDEVMTSEIKEKVLAELDISYPEVSTSWRKYDEAHGK